MGKYHPLGQFFRQSQNAKETLSCVQIASIIGDQLPPAASEHREWWANDPTHVQAKEWLDAGWKVDACVLGKDVTFIKTK